MPRPSEITVYIPCFNVARFLPRVIDALKQQTHPISEIIAVDDGSSDQSAKLAEEMGVRTLRHNGNRGLAAVRNTAIRAAKSRFVASVDGDVVAHPDWLQRMVEALADGIHVGVGGDLRETQFFSIADHWRGLHMRQSWGVDPRKDAPFLFGANTLFERQVLVDVGLYNEAHRTNGEDVDMSFRIKARGQKLVYEPKAVCDHLRSDNWRSLSRTFWRWHHPQGLPRNWSQWRTSFRYNARHLGVIFKSDIRALRIRMAAYGAWMALDWTHLETVSLLKQGSQLKKK